MLRTPLRLALLLPLLGAAACAAPTTTTEAESTAHAEEAYSGIPYSTIEYPESGIATGIAVAYQPNLVSLATELFWGDGNGRLEWKFGWQLGRWVPTNGLVVAGTPSVVVTDVNEWRVFFPATDGSFWYVDYLGYNWLPPQMIGPPGCIKPGTSISATRDWWTQYWRVYFVGPNSHVYETSHGSGPWWSGGVDTGAIAASSPSAVLRRSSGQINVFYRGTNGHLFDVWWDGVRWNTPWDHGIAMAGEPAAVGAPNEAEIDVYYATPSYYFGSSHPGVLNAAFADGSIRPIRFSVSKATWQSACVRNDGKPYNPGEL